MSEETEWDQSAGGSTDSGQIVEPRVRTNHSKLRTQVESAPTFFVLKGFIVTDSYCLSGFTVLTSVMSGLKTL